MPLGEDDFSFGFDNTGIFLGDYHDWWQFGRCVQLRSLQKLLETDEYHVCNLCIDETLHFGPQCLDGVQLRTPTINWNFVGGIRGVRTRMPEVEYFEDALSSIGRPDWSAIDIDDDVLLYVPITQYADGYAKWNFSQYQESPVGAYTSVITDYSCGHTAIPLSLLGTNQSRRVLWNKFSSNLWHLLQGIDIQVYHPIRQQLMKATLFVTLGIGMFDWPEAVKMCQCAEDENWRMDRYTCRTRIAKLTQYPHSAQSAIDYKIHIRDDVCTCVGLCY